MNASQRAWFLLLALSVPLGAALVAAAQRSPQQAEVLFESARQKEVVEEKLQEAIQLYQRIVQDHAANRPVAARALLRMGQCYERLGQADARQAELDDRLAEVAAASESRRRAHASAIVGSRAGDAAILLFSRARVAAFPTSGLLYYPFVPGSPPVLPDRFAPGEALEYRDNDYAGAAAFYREMARSSDRAIRAEALVRLARALRKANRREDALAVYGQLGQLAPARVDDVPVDLMASHARCTLFDEARRAEPLRTEAEALRAGLGQARWTLTEGAYRFYLAETSRWLAGEPQNEPGRQDALAMSACAAALWRDWQRGQLQGDRAAGRRSTWYEDRPLLEVWRRWRWPMPMGTRSSAHRPASRSSAPCGRPPRQDCPGRCTWRPPIPPRSWPNCPAGAASCWPGSS